MSKKVYVIFLLFLALIAALFLGSQKKQNTSKNVNGFFFNTFISINVYDPISDDDLNECLKICKKYELIFSRTNENSELYKLNSSGRATCSDELTDAIRLGIEYGKISNGAFDITVAPLSDLWDFSSGQAKLPSNDEIQKALETVNYNNISIEGNTVILKNNATIDLGAIAKGIIADKLEDYLISKDIKHGIINLGGNIQLIGKKSNSSNFTIGIQKPFSQDSIVALSIEDYSIVSTGTYERYFYVEDNFYHHILNPFTGYPYDNELSGVTIINKNSALCDVLSTTCFCVGMEKGLEIIKSTPDTYALFIKKDGTLIYSEGFEKKFITK